MNTTASHRLRYLSALLFAVVLFYGVSAPAAPPSRPEHVNIPYYQFNNIKHPIYEVIIGAELPSAIDSYTGHIEYDIKSVDSSNGQIAFGYSSQLHEQKQEKHPDNSNPFANIPRPSFPDPWAAPPAAPDIVVDPFGKVVRSNRMTESANLPYMLGFAWKLLLQPLSADNQPSWQTQRELSVYETKPQRQNWPPHGPFQQRQTDEDRVERPCTETETFKIGEAHGNLLTILRVYDLVSAEKTADGPVLQLHGEGQFVFDTQAGLIQSLDMKLVYKANGDNITVKVPISVTAKLLSADEAANLTAEREKQMAEMKTRMLNMSAQHSSRMEAALPEGATKTARVGMPGASEEFMQVDPDSRHVVGFRTELAKWGRNTVFRRFEPFYDRSATAAGGESVIIAKEGYTVGGLIVSALPQRQFNAVKVIFVRENKDGKIDKSDTYQSEWIGTLEGGPITRLAGNGEAVIGIFGRRGLNVDGIGLVVTGTAPPRLKPLPFSEATKVKTIDAHWQPSPGKGADILSDMTGGERSEFIGVRTLGDGDVLQSRESYQPPVTFRMVVWTSNNDIRLGYAAEQIIFNWDGGQDELRVDGGPADGQHKPGAGRLPANTWTGIEMVVHTDELVLYVDGQERYRAKGDFSGINRPLTIKSQHETTKVQSVAVVK